jgi:hypothetical protein
METTQDNHVNKKHMIQRHNIKFMPLIAGVVALLAVVIGVIWFVQEANRANLQRIDTSAYQVVYLTNGQAYFGKLQNVGGDYLVMTAPYTAQTVKDSTSTTTLLRVKDQVYGPQDSIAIKSSQVAFWQNLRSDSKVSQAIQAKQ